MNDELQIMLSRVAKLSDTSEADAARLVEQVYADGLVSRHEADALFQLKAKLALDDPMWASRFQEAIKDFLLTVEAPVGWISEAETDWLIEKLGPSEKLKTDEIDLLLDLLRQAEGAPERLSAFARTAISARIISDQRARPETVEQMRRVLFAPAGDQGLWISRDEAAMLFEVNDAIAFAKNDPAWNDLFARAIANHLLARSHPAPMTEQDALRREAWLEDTDVNLGSALAGIARSFQGGNWFSRVAYSSKRASAARRAADEAADRQAAKVTPDESDWLIARLSQDKQISSAERALIDFLKQHAPGFGEGLALVA